jgi:hypothetical protein
MDPFSIQQKHAMNVITELMEKYRDDPYMAAKLHNCICVQLPSIMENIKRTHDERQQRIADLTTEQDEFMERFLHTYRYFYVSTTETFVAYNGSHYEIAAEDDILHNILTTITAERQLMDWKQRTKVYIMKRIKDTPLLKSVPESETIQHVLDHLHPTFFETRLEAKYFLTIIGDSLFRKNTDLRKDAGAKNEQRRTSCSRNDPIGACSELVYFVQPRAKTFLRELANVSVLLFGINTTNAFRYKYYDHNYTQCRLVKINDAVDNEKLWGNLLRNISLDMLCVAAHYSIRYGSADEFISRFNNDSALESYTFFLRNTSPEQLVCRFIDEYLQVSLNGTPLFVAISPSQTPPPTPPNASNLLLSLSSSVGAGASAAGSQSPETSSFLSRSLPLPVVSANTSFQSGTGTGSVRDTTTRQISWKNIQYLWRHFLESLRLPTVIFQQNLKAILTQKLAINYKEETDSFIGVSSRFMPAIRTFIFFWENTITYEENGEYEIDELCMLYKRWLNTHTNNDNTSAAVVASANTIGISSTPTDNSSVSVSVSGSGQSVVLRRETGAMNEQRLPSYSRNATAGASSELSIGALTEKQMLDFIAYYFPATEMEKDKYVYNIRCSLWDKQLDVQTALIQMRETLRANINNDESGTQHIYATTMYDAYIWYCKYCAVHEVATAGQPGDESGGFADEDESSQAYARPTTAVPRSASIEIPTELDTPQLTERKRTRSIPKRPIVSKSFFEKYVLENMSQYVVDKKYILREWLQDADNNA